MKDLCNCKQMLYAGTAYYVLKEGERSIHLRSVDKSFGVNRDKRISVICKRNSSLLREVQHGQE